MGFNPAENGPMWVSQNDNFLAPVGVFWHCPPQTQTQNRGSKTSPHICSGNFPLRPSQGWSAGRPNTLGEFHTSVNNVSPLFPRLFLGRWRVATIATTAAAAATWMSSTAPHREGPRVHASAVATTQPVDHVAGKSRAHIPLLDEALFLLPRFLAASKQDTHPRAGRGAGLYRPGLHKLHDKFA